MKAIYVFVVNNSGISYESDLILSIGSTFFYWGKFWIVEEINYPEKTEPLEINCKEIKQAKN